MVDESREIAVRRPLRVRRFRVARSAASGAVRTVWGLVLLCALGSLVSAQDPVRVRGTGDDESAAIKSALIEAVQRVSGVQVYTDTISEEEFREIVRTISEKFDASLSSTQNVRLASRGFVRSYAVVDRGQDADGRVFVEIEAVVARPGEYRADGIMTMTIHEVGVAAGVPDGTEAAALAEAVVRQLRMMMTQTRHFRVLEEEAGEDVAAILERIERDAGFSPEERAKLGQKLSADYVFLASIRGYETEVERPEPVPIGGGQYLDPVGSPRFVYDVDLDYRLIDVARLQVVHVGEVRLTNHAGHDPLADRPRGERLEAALAKLLSRRISDAILDHVYPMKIADVDPDAGQIYIASGGRTRIEVGDQFVVYRLGREIRDPDTGEVLGQVERELGRLRIVGVQAKFSIAVPVEGAEPRDVQAGDLVRRRYE